MHQSAAGLGTHFQRYRIASDVQNPFFGDSDGIRDKFDYV